MAPEPDEPAQDLVTQSKRPDDGRFRLQVDRQTKGSYATYEAAEAAGMAIKKTYPSLQVAVYDGVESVKIAATRTRRCDSERNRSTRSPGIATVHGVGRDHRLMPR
jgi:hypothetical protein